MLNKADFFSYHDTNPKIYEKFEEFALQAIRTGRKYLGARVVLERLRWYSLIEAKHDIFKVNNNYTPFYARLFEDRNPEYKGFFRKRRSVADRGDN